MQHAHKTTDLAPEERVAVERLLGRELQNDEAVEVVTHKAAELPAAQVEERRKALARIRELAKGKSLGGATVRDLIDEGRRF
ncbi:MAG TPA: hypothetical protein VN841_28460 [Bryobacteraceae bacterium]|nr:hypothetical protein [Bryobacteraceae bacterium]